VSLVKPTVKSGLRGFLQILFYKFWTFLQVSMNFGTLKQFLLFETIRKMIKSPSQSGPKPARGYSSRSAVACYARSAETATRSRPGDSARWGKWPARPVARCVRWRARRRRGGGWPAARYTFFSGSTPAKNSGVKRAWPRAISGWVTDQEVFPGVNK
jgi:hypothetical protein